MVYSKQLLVFFKTYLKVTKKVQEGIGQIDIVVKIIIRIIRQKIHIIKINQKETIEITRTIRKIKIIQKIIRQIKGIQLIKIINLLLKLKLNQTKIKVQLRQKEIILRINRNKWIPIILINEIF